MIEGDDPVVLGLGQLTAGDDGVGVLVARSLAGRRGLEVRESTDASLLMALLEAGRRVILVDALVGPGAPGDVIHLRAGSLSSDVTPLSSHGLGVAEALDLARTLFGEAAARAVEIVGVVIERPEAPGAGLSRAVAAAVGPAATLAASLAAAPAHPCTGWKLGARATRGTTGERVTTTRQSTR